MKNLFLAFTLLIGTIISAQTTSSTFYVAAKTGLSMRDRAEVGAKVIEKIPYGTKISVPNDYQESEPIITEGMNGSWKKITYNGKKGFIIDSYLLPWAAPKLATVKDMRGYFSQVAVPFGAKLLIKSGSMNNIEEGGWELTKQMYKNGAEWHSLSGYEYGCDTYYLPGFTIQEAFLLVRLIPEFKDILGEKAEFPTSNTTIKKGEIEYKISVEKDVDINWIKKIKIEYEDGAYYEFEMFMIDTQVVITTSSGV